MYTPMVRTNYHMTEQQAAALRRMAKSTGLPMAELVRRAVEAFVNFRPD